MITYPRVFLSFALFTSLVFLSSCGSNNGQAPTPLAGANFNGTWQFTSLPVSPSSTVTGLYGTLSNLAGSTDSTSLAATGSLTIQGTCVETATATALTGTITNPHDIDLQIDLTGAGNDGTLTLNGSEVGDPTTINGTYAITNGDCQVPSTAFTAKRISQ